MKMKNSFLILLTGFLLSCSPTHNTLSSPKPTTTQKSRLPEVQYFVDINQNGSYLAVTPDKKPIPIQGKDQWTRDFYTTIKYPAIARKNGITGIVILDVLIDEWGVVQEVVIKKSLSKECDEASIKAFKEATHQGYTPTLYNSKAVRCRMDIPVGFWFG